MNTTKRIILLNLNLKIRIYTLLRKTVRKNNKIILYIIIRAKHGGNSIYITTCNICVPTNTTLCNVYGISTVPSFKNY